MTNHTYTVTMALHIPDALPHKDLALPLSPVEVPPEPTLGSGVLKVGIVPEARRTIFNIVWSVDLPGEPDPEAAERLGVLWFHSNGQVVVRDIALDLVKLMHPVVVRLAAITESSSFLSAFLDTPYRDLVASCLVEYSDKKFEAQVRSTKSNAVHPSPRRLNASEVEAVLRRQTHLHEIFLTQADRFNSRFEPASAIVSLATALEVASYYFLRSRSLPEDEKFNPQKYLGSGYPKSNVPSLRDQNLAAYSACHELWGARNEIVHEGKYLVRLYDEKRKGKFKRETNEKRKGKYKEETRQLRSTDFAIFRRAVRDAIAWMEHAAVGD